MFEGTPAELARARLPTMAPAYDQLNELIKRALRADPQSGGIACCCSVTAATLETRRLEGPTLGVHRYWLGHRFPVLGSHRHGNGRKNSESKIVAVWKDGQGQLHVLLWEMSPADGRIKWMNQT